MMPRIRPETRRRLIAAGLVIAAFAAMQPLRVSVNRLRSRYELTPPAGELHLGEFVGTVLLGGFRGIAVDLLWIKALDARRTHDWHSLLAINRLIADLQPRFTRVWEFNMWNMTTNLARRAPTSREGWQWLKRGIEFGKEGHRRNPRNWRLAYAIGYEYFYRCGALDDALTRKFQAWLLEETGRSNWQHALEWFTRAWEQAGPDADPDCLEMLPETHGRMALEAEARGDHAEMRSQRMQAIDRLEKLAAAYAADEQFAANARRKVADLRGRLQAHELEQQAARLPAGKEKFDLLCEAAAQWKAAYRANPWQTEQIRHLEAIAAQMESMAHGATAAFRSRLDAEILDIWLRLLSGPHRVGEWMEKGDQLDTAWSAKLNDAVAAGDLQLAGRSLEAVAELRMWLFEKDPSKERSAALRALAAACENLAPRAPEVQREAIARIERSAWLAILRAGYAEGADRGIELLKRRAESTRREAVSGPEAAAEQRRREALEIARALFRYEAHRQWAEGLLRETGEHYTAAIAAAVGKGDLEHAADYVQRGRAVWQQILQCHPGDPQAQDNLNRIAEILKIVASQDAPR